MAKRDIPEINAASMADIAFLLLIFFLVTTTIETDSGISRRLPPPTKDITEIDHYKRNLLIVLINKDDRIMVNDDPIELNELRQRAIEFLDNGGGTGEEACTYCQGARNPELSDNPDKAIISLQNDRLTTYKMYIAVQNELVAAYNDLRDREGLRLYGTTYRELEKNFLDPNWRGNKVELEEQVKTLRNMFPQKLSEAEPRK